MIDHRCHGRVLKYSIAVAHPYYRLASPAVCHNGSLAQKEMSCSMQAFQGHTKCYSHLSMDMPLSMFFIQWMAAAHALPPFLSKQVASHSHFGSEITVHTVQMPSHVKSHENPQYHFIRSESAVEECLICTCVCKSSVLPHIGTAIGGATSLLVGQLGLSQLSACVRTRLCLGLGGSAPIMSA